MKRFVVAAVVTLLACSGQTSEVRTYPLRPAPIQPVRRVEVEVGSVTKRATVVRNANGREVPLETTEERVISDSGGVRIVERVVTRYAPSTGNALPPERTRIETRKEADGSERTITTVSRGDVNGAMRLAERSVAVTRASGSTQETSMLTERPTLNGGFEVAERREVSTRDLGGGKSSSSAVVQRPDPNGRMVDVARRTVERIETPRGITENEAEYETASTGQMRLSRQFVTTTEVAPDGSSVRQVDVFELTPQNQRQLARRQVVETVPTATGAVETVSAGVAQVGEPGRIGQLVPVERTVCTGECGKKK